MLNNRIRHVLMLGAAITALTIGGAAIANDMKKNSAESGSTKAERAVTLRAEADGLVTKATKTVGDFESSKISHEFHRALAKGRAVLIVPEYERAGLGLGGEGGKGVLLKKMPGTTAWTYPAFYRMSGATLGAQVGFEKGAMFVVIQNQQTLDEIMNGELTLGAEARAVIGSKGVQAQTTKTGGHEIDIFVRTKGAFAGAVVKGGDLKPDEKLNRTYYGRKVSAKEVLRANGPRNPQADALRAALSKLVYRTVTAPTN
ncbi:MAG: lipid-binding SYLF domain-containing protein [Alphaproteobacteria bacterium]|nr:lipid-binding SYLF domain-containing protein [Alphaproteobacteria bacterium]